MYQPPTPNEFLQILTDLQVDNVAAARYAGLARARSIRRYLPGCDREVPFSVLQSIVVGATDGRIILAPESWRERLEPLLGKRINQ